MSLGAFALLTQFLYPWYLPWLVPLLAIYLRPGVRTDAWTGWWLFSGLVMQAYTRYIAVAGLNWTFAAQFLPLTALLLLPTVFNKNMRQAIRTKKSIARCVCATSGIVRRAQRRSTGVA